MVRGKMAVKPSKTGITANFLTCVQTDDSPTGIDIAIIPLFLFDLSFLKNQPKQN